MDGVGKEIGVLLGRIRPKVSLNPLPKFPVRWRSPSFASGTSDGQVGERFYAWVVSQESISDNRHPPAEPLLVIEIEHTQSEVYTNYFDRVTTE
jgi:hypothetical protein